jgi:hypothetical protein
MFMVCSAGGGGVINHAQYAADCLRGAEEARVFIRTMVDGGNLAALGWVVKDLVASGTFGGREVGFFREIAGALAQHEANQIDMGGADHAIAAAGAICNEQARR